MNQIPIRNGKECVYRVVRVSGTVRKAEEEAIRRARAIIMRARKEASEKGGVVLEGLFSAEVGEVVRDVRELVRDVDMGVVDGSDEEEEEEEEEAESAED
jgi:ribonuclease P/MRP protein subunit POP5